MDRLLEYTIPFKGLSEGIHEFEFQPDKEFFEEFENSEIFDANATVRLDFIKRSSFMQMKFHLSGMVSIMCDRCLEAYDQLIENEFSLLMKFSEEVDENEEEIVFLHPTAHSVNVAQYVYEYIVLSLPLQKIHPNDEEGNSTCNVEMLNKLNEHLIEEEDDDDEPVDSRWSELKKLLDN